MGISEGERERDRQTESVCDYLNKDIGTVGVLKEQRALLDDVIILLREIPLCNNSRQCPPYTSTILYASTLTATMLGHCYSDLRY